ncbi:protein-glutamate methylesterase/protein-glutamine glutaminase [Gulbenkiania mobilis]|uniref:Protein-glutamate methylesterase/protein-glutamine glutaminase n=1 Tax=Gulbenkiania mobilis TaxID=397457 RepID=A0ABY2D2E7_GULMO|nr:two-component system chemotaxis response regulator CheB [Gulbenkiania mobilis]
MDTAPARKIRVVVVDDSALIRSVLTEIINTAGDMEVVATAADPLIARERIREHDPDVITLDVEMPRMDGIEFLRRLMRLRPTPVVMISSLTAQGSSVALEALSLGAVDVMPKPAFDLRNGLQGYAEDIRERLRGAARARVRPAAPRVTGSQPLPPPHRRLPPPSLIAIGASTGGTEAIREVLEGLPAVGPPIVIVQHMPALFTRTFAARLDRLCPMQVKEAEDGEVLRPGWAYLAPGGATHMAMRTTLQGWCVVLQPTPPVNRHRPAVDVLFDAVAREAGRRCVAVLLTGMGKDGAQGMLHLRQAGAYTLAQDEATSVVYGMPREAVVLGAVDEELPLEMIAPRIRTLLVGRTR